MPQNIRELWGKISQLFDPGGGVSRSLPAFESRPGQKEMAHLIFQAMMQECMACIEAGTGTGKTLAYLIPSLYISQALGEPTVISTKTINLQEQLIHSDIPLLMKATGENFKTALVKGWSNYLCLRRFHRLELSGDLLDLDELKSIQEIREWQKTTATGDLSDAQFEAAPGAWERVRAESSACTFSRCPWFEECFFFKSRRQIKNAAIVIINHALLFTQVAQKRSSPQPGWSVLPEFKRLVIDEAHHVEETASNFLGDDASGGEFSRILQSLIKTGGDKEGGLLVRIRNSKFSPGLEGRIRNILDTYLFPRLSSLQESFDAFTYQVIRIPLLQEEQDKILLNASFRSQSRELAGESFQLFQKEINGYLKELNRLGEEGIRENEDLSAEAASMSYRLENFRDSLVRIWNGLEEGMIYSLEYSRRPRGDLARFRSYPLNTGGILYDELFKPLKTVIFTSATLSVNNSFNYAIRQLGLEKLNKDMVLTKIIDSPFDFKKKALLSIPTDMPDAAADDFLKMAVPHLARLVRVMEGRTFILFTSYKMLEECGRMLEERLKTDGFNIHIQGRHPRHVLLNRFREQEKSVLLGTDSFWEGVDVPGRDLECVVMMKLPFRVPTDPIIKARTDFIEKSGQNPFLSYYVPQAVIRFKQGFGRLIRHRKDRGVIVILDGRILSRSYGRAFLQSLPQCHILRGSFAGNISAIEKWKEKYENRPED